MAYNISVRMKKTKEFLNERIICSYCGKQMIEIHKQANEKGFIITYQCLHCGGKIEVQKKTF